MNINLKLCLLGTITLGAILVSPSAARADDEAVFSGFSSRLRAATSLPAGWWP